MKHSLKTPVSIDQQTPMPMLLLQRRDPDVTLTRQSRQNYIPQG